MAARRDSRQRRRRGVRAALVVVLALVIGGAALVEHRTGRISAWVEGPDPQAEPEAVPPPPGLTMPTFAPVVPVAEPAPTAAPDPRAVRRALAPLLRDEDLGRHVVALVAPLDGEPVFARGAGTVVPASTTKLVTTAAALAALGPDHVFTTRVVRSGPRRLTLVGGGDPLLASAPPTATDEAPYPTRADVVALAEATATALRGETRPFRLEYDASLFPGTGINPAWEPSYVPDQIVAPVSALWVDEGRPESGIGRVDDPAAHAAQVFAAALRDAGVRVRGTPAPGLAGDAAELAAVESAPVEQIVEHVLDTSDNEAAEVLARHVGLAETGDGSVRGGRLGVEAAMARVGVSLDGDRLLDGSGLSRRSRVEAESLVDVLQAAATQDDLRAVITGLPVAGFTGSLELRFEDAPEAGRGRVRAKTGTLTGVSGLAGVVTDLDGTTMIFAFLTDRVAVPDTLDARDALDAAAAALAACHCGRE